MTAAPRTPSRRRVAVAICWSCSNATAPATTRRRSIASGMRALRGDRTGALQLLDQDPALRSEVADTDGSALIGAAETGNTQAIELLLEVGFPAAAQAGSDGATALHVAAWAGSVEAVKQLLAAGAPLDAHDSRWHSTPLEWALVGSGERRATNPPPTGSRPCASCSTPALRPARSSSTPPNRFSRARRSPNSCVRAASCHAQTHDPDPEPGLPDRCPPRSPAARRPLLQTGQPGTPRPAFKIDGGTSYVAVQKPLGRVSTCLSTIAARSGT